MFLYFQLNHLNNRQKMFKTKQKEEEEERLKQKKQISESEESNQLEIQEKKDH